MSVSQFYFLEKQRRPSDLATDSTNNLITDDELQSSDAQIFEIVDSSNFTIDTENSESLHPQRNPYNLKLDNSCNDAILYALFSEQSDGKESSASVEKKEPMNKWMDCWESSFLQIPSGVFS